MTTQVLIVAGGQSAEHTISLASARCVLQAINDAPTLTAQLRVITRSGGVLDEQASLLAVQQGTEVSAPGAPLGELLTAAKQADVVLPLLHGPMGEDGTLQGLLTLAQVPYVGCGVLASALCMDKPMTKEVLRAQGLPQVPYVTVTAHDWRTQSATVSAAIAEQLPSPWFVKPANMGSSVGITKVTEAQALGAAIELSLSFDRRVIVEAGLEGVRELEVAVVGNDVLQVSPVGEICHDGGFYDYATKYTLGHSTMAIPANVPEAISAAISELSRKTYSLLDCAGLARIDFFYTPKDGRVFVNEVNTLPGFTTFSMFPSLMAASGLTYAALLQRLVQLAIERHRPVAHAP